MTFNLPVIFFPIGTCCFFIYSAYSLEARLLGNVQYFNDLIVTHEDEDYMLRWIEIAL